MGEVVAGFSGGKDSTAMVLRLAELGTPPDRLLFNITGDELPDLLAHLRAVQALVGAPLELTTPGFSLAERIRHYDALPNSHMRWCTRELKIEPTILWLQSRPGRTLLVALRADEEGRAGGLYGDLCEQRFPLREWGWGLGEVQGYLKARGVEVPPRTDCALCYGQRLSEWYRLWRDHPGRYAKGEELEALTGHTFRSPSRDSWPAALKDLRAQFERGRAPRGILDLPLFGTYEAAGVCRVCRM